MKLTVLGNNGPFSAIGGACSGYLLSHDDKNILIDCGNGVLSNLQRFTSLESLDAIILTHLHSDHMADMLILRYALQLKRNKGLINRAIDLYLPDEPVTEYNLLNIQDIFNLVVIAPELEVNFRDLRVNFRKMTHPVKCFAVSFQYGQKKFVYSGDTSWNNEIAIFAKDADLLMLDAGLRTVDKVSDNVPHLTAAECGKVAVMANAKKLLLTHFNPEFNIENLRAEALEYFDNTETTEILKTYVV